MSWEYSKKELLIMGPLLAGAMAVEAVERLGRKIKRLVKGKKKDNP